VLHILYVTCVSSALWIMLFAALTAKMLVRDVVRPISAAPCLDDRRHTLYTVLQLCKYVHHTLIRDTPFTHTKCAFGIMACRKCDT
jgi:hypothetical protein